MNNISELLGDLKFIISFRKEKMKQMLELDLSAPKAGDIAIDFTLLERDRGVFHPHERKRSEVRPRQLKSSTLCRC